MWVLHYSVVIKRVIWCSLMIWFCFLPQNLASGQDRRPGGHSGAAPLQITACAPPNENCAFPPSEDCATKKLTGSELLKCNAKSETSKILVIIPKFVEIRTFLEKKTRIHRNSRIFLRWWPFFYFGLHRRFRTNSCSFWDEDQNSWTFAYFLRWGHCFWVSTLDFVEFCGAPFFLVLTFKFKEVKFSCPTKICLCPPAVTPF